MIDFYIVDLHFHTSAQYLTQSGSQCSKMQIVSSLIKCVIWETVYERYDSCNSSQTPGTSVLLKMTLQLESVAEALGGGVFPGLQRGQIEKTIILVSPQGLICSLCCNTGPFLLAFLFSMRLPHQRSTFLLLPLLLAFNEEWWVKVFPLENHTYCISRITLTDSLSTNLNTFGGTISLVPFSHSSTWPGSQA